jgi:cobalamin-dependent methionine synthase I
VACRCDDARRQFGRGVLEQDGRRPALCRQRTSSNRRCSPRNWSNWCRAIVDVPLCIDSSVPGRSGRTALEAVQGAPASQFGDRRRRPARSQSCRWSRSTTCRSLRYQMTRRGSLKTRMSGSRWRKNHRRARRPIMAFKAHDIVVDPLVMPIGAMSHRRASRCFQLVRRLREELKRQHDVRRLEYLIRPAEPARHQQRPFCRWQSAAGMTSARS